MQHTWRLRCAARFISARPGCHAARSCPSEAALDKLCSIFAWSFRACTSGRWPADPPPGAAMPSAWAARAGQELAGGFRGSYVAWKGDRKSRVQEHRLNRTWQTTSVCEWCEAVIPFASAATPLLTYADCRPCAPHA
jgi:hypothetical protein